MVRGGCEYLDGRLGKIRSIDYEQLIAPSCQTKLTDNVIFTQSNLTSCEVSLLEAASLDIPSDLLPSYTSAFPPSSRVETGAVSGDTPFLTTDLIQSVSLYSPYLYLTSH